MAFLSSIPAVGVEEELSRLRAENNALAEELVQVQADKEFVWSLWKRLQVANPDITQAVGMVVQREREKAEYKDRKVLDILQIKDDKLDDLQKVVSTQSKELSSVLARKVELQDQVTKLRAENTDLEDKNAKLEAKAEDLELRVRDRHDIVKDMSRGLEKEVQELKQNVAKSNEEVQDLHKDKADLVAIRDSQRDRITKLEAEFQELDQMHSKTLKEQDNSKKAIKKLEKQLTYLQKDVEDKNRELETVRKELSDLWATHNEMSRHAQNQADVINQLQDLHKDTTQMLKSQENVFSVETSSLQKMYTELSQRYQALQMSGSNMRNQLMDSRQRLHEREITIRELEDLLNGSKNVATQVATMAEDKEVQAYEIDPELEIRMEDMQTEVRKLRHKVKDQTRMIEVLERPTRDTNFRSTSLSRHSRSRSASISPSRSGEGRSLAKKLANCEKKLGDTKELLRMRTRELEELRQAHDQRVERLKSLQSQYRLARKQLKVAEEELHGVPKKKKKLRRSDPKSLQKEDSDTVWNELAYFKHEAKNLQVERMNLQEEVDTFRVQAAQDAATIHELRTSLEQEREELQFLTEQQHERSSTPTPDEDLELESARSKIHSLEKRLKDLQEDSTISQKEKGVLLEEKRDLRSESNSLKQEAADRRVEIADLKREILRLQRELRRRKMKKASRTQIARQYQKILNKSIRDMSVMFDSFNKDGWEEISESEELTEVTTTSTDQATLTETQDSLGTSIAQTALKNSSQPGASPGKPTRPTVRQMESVDDHVRRMNKKNETPVKDASDFRPITAPKTESRSIALSPIHFLSSSAPPSPKVTSKKFPTGIGRQSAAHRQRISSLTREVTLLKSGKNLAAKRDAEQKRAIDQLQNDLTQTTQKLSNSRFTVQRLSMDVERLRVEKEVLEQQLEDSSVDSTSSHSQQEWASMQAKLRIANSEVSKQLSQIKQLKVDSTCQAEKILQLQDRASHLERDLGQKRTLVDDARLKLKIAHENAQCDADVMLEAEGKLKAMSDTNSRMKTQLESFRQRLAAVTREKYENEDKVVHLSEELEKKSKQVADLQKRRSELQCTVNELERTAQEQLHMLANESEAAIDSAQAKLTATTGKLQEFNKFVRILAHALVNSIQQALLLLEQQKKRKEQQAKPDSLRQAQDKAATILNLSQSEMDDLLNGDADSSESSETDSSKQGVGRRERGWWRRWEKLVQGPEFAVGLVALMMEKVEERTKLAAELSIV